MRQYDYVPHISTKFPITERMVRSLKKLGIKRIQLSIDSVNSEEMQKILNVSEYYTEQVLFGLQLLNKARFEITVKPVITKYNDSEKSLNDTIDVLTSYPNVRHVNFTPAGYSQFKPTTYYSTRSQLTRLKTIVEQRNRDCDAELSFLGYDECQTEEERERNFPNRPLCTGNVHGFFVLPDGKVTICEQMYWHPFFILGDLTQQSIMEIWDSKLALSKWKFSQDEVRDVSPCKMCEEFDACRRGLGNCWRQAISAYGPENYDFPAPNCPKAPPVPDNFYIP
jgi:radical SAM protein with 4Fe4S-binding SPASM domain